MPKYKDEFVALSVQVKCGKCKNVFEYEVQEYDICATDYPCDVCGHHGNVTIDVGKCPVCGRFINNVVVNEW